jgi:hypothetical protein
VFPVDRPGPCSLSRPKVRLKQGNLRVEIHFAEALTATTNVIMYAEFDNVIEIDRDRQVLFDYSAYMNT